MMKALATNRPYVKMRGTTTEATVVRDREVTIMGEPGAVLTRIYSGPVLVIGGTSRVVVSDLEVSGATGASGIGIALELTSDPVVTLIRVIVRNNAAGGVVAGNGLLIARRSKFVENFGGGLSLFRTQFDLENNVIAGNGNSLGLSAGLYISEADLGPRRFEFNTVTGNDAAPGTTTGVGCFNLRQPITLSNNIVYGNNSRDGRTQVIGVDCTWTYSDIGPGGVHGGGNIDVDPRFIDWTHGDFHLGPGSPAVDRADPKSVLGVDLDGMSRPHGSGRDMGAFEQVP